MSYTASTFHTKKKTWLPIFGLVNGGLIARGKGTRQFEFYRFPGKKAGETLRKRPSAQSGLGTTVTGISPWAGHLVGGRFNTKPHTTKKPHTPHPKRPKTTTNPRPPQTPVRKKNLIGGVRGCTMTN